MLVNPNWYFRPFCDTRFYLDRNKKATSRDGFQSGDVNHSHKYSNVEPHGERPRREFSGYRVKSIKRLV